MCVFTLLDIVWNLPKTRKEFLYMSVGGERLGCVLGDKGVNLEKNIWEPQLYSFVHGYLVAHLFVTWYLNFLLENHISVASSSFICDVIVQTSSHIRRTILCNTSVAFSLSQTKF